MAKGEMRYTGSGAKVQRFDNKPIAEGDYQLELDDNVKVGKSTEKGPDAIPYINTQWRALGTEAKDADGNPKPGAKNRVVFHKFFLSLKPGSDGVLMPERGGGILEFCRSFGEEPSFAIKTLTKSDDTTEDYLDSEEVEAYVKSKVGEVKAAHVTIEKQKGPDKKLIPGHPGQNKIAYWELDEGAMSGEAEAPAKPAPAKGNVNLPKKAAGKK